ncbi:hypothetical protein [Conexibacter arvalis]|uniref:Uncharacterized protein n=1 Tax=Conexibacter arvalis TaxID=912552 RepID=A0A840IHL3_9ACTN|nr:hypothetical protein [Conexibacter arvalis]MBB4663711.1 hypothetical protein [Conexibacter arvalis]
MSTQGYEDKPAGPSLLKKGVAALILIVVLAFALKVVIGFVMGIFWIIVGVAVLIALLWALNTLL